MDLVKLLYFILVVTNAGGEGKTLIAKLIQAIWEIGGIDAVILDGDVGNYSSKSTDETAKVVGWGVKPQVAPEIVASTINQHAIMDLGANAMASAREVADLVPALEEHYRKDERRCIAFLPVSTNKSGAVGAINTLEEKVAYFDKYVVKVDRDLSGNFDGDVNSPILRRGFKC